MLPPKTSNHAKFHRNRSNQLGYRGWSEKNSTHRQTDWHTHGILTGWVAPHSMREARLKIQLWQRQCSIAANLYRILRDSKGLVTACNRWINLKVTSRLSELKYSTHNAMLQMYTTLHFYQILSALVKTWQKYCKNYRVHFLSSHSVHIVSPQWALQSISTSESIVRIAPKLQ